MLIKMLFRFIVRTFSTFAANICRMSKIENRYFAMKWITKHIYGVQ